MTSSTALTIGNFDGVHRGHVELVQRARKTVGLAGTVYVLSFDPHPLSVLRPEQLPPRLTTFDRRRSLLEQAGADQVVAIEPTRDFLAQSASDFITSIVQSYQPGAIIEGPDFRFGRGRGGTVDTLRELGKFHGFQTIIIEPIMGVLSDHSVVTVSSSMVRWLVQRGRMRDAARLLGRPYELHGIVVRGDQRGRNIGVPTINLDHGDLLLPRDGVYAGAAQRDGRTYRASISIGTKPTFGEHARVCEAHLLDYDGPLDDYGWDATVQFDHFLRDQLIYTDVQPLVEQIGRDNDRVRREITMPNENGPAPATDTRIATNASNHL